MRNFKKYADVRTSKLFKQYFGELFEWMVKSTVASKCDKKIRVISISSQDLAELSEGVYFFCYTSTVFNGSSPDVPCFAETELSFLFIFFRNFHAQPLHSRSKSVPNDDGPNPLHIQHARNAQQGTDISSGPDLLRPRRNSQSRVR